MKVVFSSKSYFTSPFLWRSSSQVKLVLKDCIYNIIGIKLVLKDCIYNIIGIKLVLKDCIYNILYKNET